MRNYILLTTLLSTLVLAQHSIPYASQNNVIELSIANRANVTTENIIVEVQQAPSWITFKEKKTEISNLESQSSKLARFTFSVAKSSPVITEEEISFLITNASGEQWRKTLSIQILPPEKFELYQNYPNPFNPTTTIAYELPEAKELSLTIFDALGREVATLDEGKQEAGYHEVQWNAKDVSSGVYFYQFVLKSNGKREFYRRKMLVVK